MKIFARSLIALGILGSAFALLHVVNVASSPAAGARHVKYVAPTTPGNEYYHAPTCPNAGKVSLRFYTQDEAEYASGLLPAPCCLTEVGRPREPSSAQPQSRAGKTEGATAGSP